MKRVTIGLASVTAILVAGVLFLYSSLGAIITRAVNTMGPEITQAEVSLNKTTIDATSGKGSMHDLSIGNPVGFKTKSAFQMNQIEITLETESITANTVIINEINIQSPEITYEVGPNGSNIDAIQRNIDAFVQKHGKVSKAGKSSEAKEGNPENETRLIIEHLYVTGGKVNVSATLPGAETAVVPLPDIHLKDIGKKQNGITAGEVTKAIMDALKIAILKAVISVDLKNLTNSAGKLLKGTAEVVQDAMGEVSQDIGATLQKSTEGVTDAMSGIFGK